MFNYRKILTIIVVFIILVLMIGFTFDLSPLKTGFKKTASPKNSALASDMDISMTLEPGYIPAAPKSLFDKKAPIEEISKTVITVAYRNKAEKDSVGTEIWLSVKNGKNYGYFTTASAKYIERKPFDSVTRSEIARFKVPDAKAGQTEKAEIYLYSHVPDSMLISAQVKTSTSTSVMTQPFILIVR